VIAACGALPKVSDSMRLISLCISQKRLTGLSIFYASLYFPTSPLTSSNPGAWSESLPFPDPMVKATRANFMGGGIIETSPRRTQHYMVESTAPHEQL
jgi:hypothetical protein